MPILDIQKRARELGRIRLGQKGANGAPQKLDRFRITSQSKPLLEKIAALYGGEVKEWTPAGGAQQWEVVTNANRLPIMVPPQPVSQWHEAWRTSGCVHRCNGVTNVLTDELCDADDPLHQEALTKPTTRLNVVLRDVEGVGVFRTETHGWNAAMELPNAAEFLAQAGGYVEGWLSLEERVSKTIINDKPQTRRFMVPIIEIDVTPAELMAGKGRVATPTIEGPVPAAAALPAGSVDAFTPFFERLAAASTFEECQAIWQDALAAKLVGPQSEPSARRDEFFAASRARGRELPNTDKPAPQPDEDGVYPADVVDDGEAADAVWQRILKAGGDIDLSLTDLNEEYARFSGGEAASVATAQDLERFLDHLGTLAEAVSA